MDPGFQPAVMSKQPAPPAAIASARKAQELEKLGQRRAAMDAYVRAARVLLATHRDELRPVAISYVEHAERLKAKQDEVDREAKREADAAAARPAPPVAPGPPHAPAAEPAEPPPAPRPRRPRAGGARLGGEPVGRRDAGRARADSRATSGAGAAYARRGPGATAERAAARRATARLAATRRPPPVAPPPSPPSATLDAQPPPPYPGPADPSPPAPVADSAAARRHTAACRRTAARRRAASDFDALLPPPPYPGPGARPAAPRGGGSDDVLAAGRTILAIEGELGDIEPHVARQREEPDAKLAAGLDEMLTQAMCKLDGVECHGDEELRGFRKRMVERAAALSEQLRQAGVRGPKRHSQRGRRGGDPCAGPHDRDFLMPVVTWARVRVTPARVPVTDRAHDRVTARARRHCRCSRALCPPPPPPRLFA